MATPVVDTILAMRPPLQPLQPSPGASSSSTATRTAPAVRRSRVLLVACALIVAACFAMLASEPQQAGAVPLATKRAQAAKLDAEVSRLEQRYDDLQERYRGAQYELDQVRRDVERAHTVVVATRRDLRVAKLNLAKRAAAIYRQGGTSSDLTELARAGSFTDFFERIDTIRRVGDQDADVLVRVEELNDTVAKRERELRRARDRAAVATRHAKAAAKAMSDILAQRRDKLESVNADIRAIMAEQRRAAAARAAASARESAALASPGEAYTGGSSDNGGSGVSIPLPPGSSTAAAAASAAMGKIGSPYVWAAAGPDTFDCSGLVIWAFAQAGRSGLPHSTYSLVTMGVEVPMDQLQVGDLVFGYGDGHVGIYVGGGSMVHAPHSGDVVRVASIDSMSHARRL